MGEIRLGTSGYKFEDWKGTVYPQNIRDSDMFAHYVNQFRLNSVELNYTYYVMPSRRVFESYACKCPKDFEFTVKLYGGIPHDPWLGNSPLSVNKELCARFLSAMEPWAETDKLGCILAQFPPHMRPSDMAWDFLFTLRNALSGYRLVYEFRHKDWISRHTISTLKQVGIGFCAVDAPLVGPLMPLVPAVTSDIAYLRLHGRNRLWFKDASVRYDYFYSPEELRALLPTIRSMAMRSGKIYIQFNNCHAGSALRNVKMMQYLLGLNLPPAQGVLF